MTITKRDSYCINGAQVAEGTNANTYKTTAAISAVLNGRVVNKAATDNVAFSAGHAAQGASKVAAYFVLMDSAGALTTQQSSVENHSTSQQYVPGAFEWPDPVDKVVVGAIKVATNASGAFTAASTDLGAANQTVTYFDAALDYGKPIPY